MVDEPKVGNIIVGKSWFCWVVEEMDGEIVCSHRREWDEYYSKSKDYQRELLDGNAWSVVGLVGNRVEIWDDLWRLEPEELDLMAHRLHGGDLSIETRLPEPLRDIDEDEW